MTNNYLFICRKFLAKRRNNINSSNTRLSSFSKRTIWHPGLPFEWNFRIFGNNLLKIIFVTHASIIDIAFSKKFDNFSSTKNKTLCYQESINSFGSSVTNLMPLHYRKTIE